ncbi:hypothetical protein LEMLEM_LOCUS14309 [Lemmus lemmus]
MDAFMVWKNLRAKLESSWLIRVTGIHKSWNMHSVAPGLLQLIGEFEDVWCAPGLLQLIGSSGSRPGRMPRQAEETTKSRRMHRPYRLTDAGATSAGWTKKRRKQRNVSYESGKELMPRSSFLK